MLSRSYRIPKNKFPEILRGKTYQNDFFRMVVTHDKKLVHARCAVIVAQKQVTSAVDRNTIRRQAYQTLAEHAHRLPSAWICIILKKKLGEDQKTSSLVQELIAQL